MALSKKEREILKKKLPHGSQVSIAQELGCSKMSVCHYFAGKTDSLRVEEKAVEMYQQMLQRERKIRKIINATKG